MQNNLSARFSNKPAVVVLRATLFCVLCASIFSLHAQGDERSLRFGDVAVGYPADLDSMQVDSFFLSKTIDLRKCDKPELYFEIFRWYRTCYRYAGNSGKGIDCSHFVNMLYEKLYGVKLNGSSSSIYSQCKPVKGGIEEAVEGDLLFFKIKKKRISHIGIYLQHNKFAHASTQAGVIISDLSEPYYKKHFYKVARLEP